MLLNNAALVKLQFPCSISNSKHKDTLDIMSIRTFLQINTKKLPMLKIDYKSWCL